MLEKIKRDITTLILRSYILQPSKDESHLIRQSKHQLKYDSGTGDHVESQISGRKRLLQPTVSPAPTSPAEEDTAEKTCNNNSSCLRLKSLRKAWNEERLIGVGSLEVAVLETHNVSSMSTVNAKILELKGEPISAGLSYQMTCTRGMIGCQ